MFFLFFSQKIHSYPIFSSIFDYKLNQVISNSVGNWVDVSIFNNSISENLGFKFLKNKRVKYGLNTSMSKEDIFSNFSFLGSYKNFYSYFLVTMGKGNSNLNFNSNISQSFQKYNQKKLFEIPHSGFGYKNNWLNANIRRGNEDWGAGNNISLALSENSKTFDYLTLESNYGRIKVKYIHGFLEKTLKNQNRFLVAKGLEWTNKRFLNIGFSEIIIYSGKNRTFDIGYLNPISSHIEIELNNRLNIIGSSNSNAVWQFHLDTRIKNLRLSMNFLIDEFVIDQEIEKNKNHGKAFSSKILYNLFNGSNNIINVFCNYIYVGTPTFRHSIGTNNFSLKNIPLGWSGGSDAESFSYGFIYSNNNSTLISWEYGFSFSGDENILARPFERYKNYEIGKFPSGNIVKNSYSITSMDIKINNYSSFESKIEISSIDQFLIVAGVSLNF